MMQQVIIPAVPKLVLQGKRNAPRKGVMHRSVVITLAVTNHIKFVGLIELKSFYENVFHPFDMVVICECSLYIFSEFFFFCGLFGTTTLLLMVKVVYVYACPES